MMCLILLLWAGNRLRANLKKFVCSFYVTMLNCAIHTGQGSVFWCVGLLGVVGGPFCQLLSSYTGASFACCSTPCSWLAWLHWMLYCPMLNELISAFLPFGLQFIRLYIVLHLFYDVIELGLEYSSCFAWELDDSAAGRVVRSSVATGEGVQPWLIAPSCTSPCSLWSMMKPNLAETYYLYNLCLSLEMLLLHFRPKSFELDSLQCAIQVEILPQVVPFASPIWQTHTPLQKPWHTMQFLQQQHSFVVARDWQPLYVALIFAAPMQRLPLICCLCSMYWPINCTAILLYSRIVYHIYHVNMIMIKFLAREFIRQFWPYDSKARYQYAYGHRIGHIQAVWFDGPKRIDLVLCMEP